MKHDFVYRFADYVNLLFTGRMKVSVGGFSGVGNEEVTVLMIPGGQEKVYFDGSRDKEINLQVNAKSADIVKAHGLLNELSYDIENVVNIPSDNGSYEFNGVTMKSAPFLLQSDSTGIKIYAVTLTASIMIEGK